MRSRTTSAVPAAEASGARRSWAMVRAKPARARLERSRAACAVSSRSSADRTESIAQPTIAASRGSVNSSGNQVATSRGSTSTGTTQGGVVVTRSTTTAAAASPTSVVPRRRPMRRPACRDAISMYGGIAWYVTAWPKTVTERTAASSSSVISATSRCWLWSSRRDRHRLQALIARSCVATAATARVCGGAPAGVGLSRSASRPRATAATARARRAKAAIRSSRGVSRSTSPPPRARPSVQSVGPTGGEVTVGPGTDRATEPRRRPDCARVAGRGHVPRRGGPRLLPR